MSEHPQHRESALAGAAGDDPSVVEVVEVEEHDVVEVDDDGTGTVVEGVDVVTVAEVAVVTDVSEADEDPDAAGLTDTVDEDAAADERVDRLDDGSSAVGGRPAAEALPFTMSVREHFAAVDVLEGTGDARVDAAAARLADVPDLPTADHVEVYEDVHKRLQDALAEAEVR